MTDHGSQFFANEVEGRRRGEAAFEAELKRLGIRHVLARIRRPQTNGKIERIRKEIERRQASFEAESSRTATGCDRPGGGGGHFTVGSQFRSKGPMDPIDRLAEWYNYERSHAARRGRDAGRGARPQDAPKGVTVLD